MTVLTVDRPQTDSVVVRKAGGNHGMLPAESIWPLSVDQYHAMIRTGILTEDDPVELLEGWLVAKMPKNPPHSLTTELLRESLTPFLPEGWHIRSQEPITTSDSEPEPDVAVIRGRRRQFADRHPMSADIALVVEVADATLQRDRTKKKQLYAQAGIPIYWVVNLVERQIEVYSEPAGRHALAEYRRQQIYQATEEIAIQMDGVERGRIAITELLP